MNKFTTGQTIKKLRKENKLTQNNLANLLKVSNKTISKWETGKGYPDIEMLEPLAKVLKASILELLNGDVVSNTNISSNLLKSKFYICPICGNVITSIGESIVSCHGMALHSNTPKEDDGLLRMDKIENEYYVTVQHDMKKSNYISFICAIGIDSIQMKKLYPEEKPEAYFQIRGVKFIYYYSNTEGLFKKTITKNKNL